MRRILIFSLVYYPKFVGGAEVAVKEITDRISSEDVHFDMITLNGGGDSTYDRLGNVTVHRIFSRVGIVQKVLYPFVAYKKAIKLNHQNHYE